MTVRSFPGLAVTAAILSGLALSACAAASPARSTVTATPSASRATVTATAIAAQLTGPQLKARLLAVGDLPAGYGPYPISDDAPDSSDKPACLATLNSLSGYSPPPSPVTEASAAFAASLTGPWVLEDVRSYPGAGAAAAFTAAKTALSGCQTFSVAWTSPAETATESVTPTAAPALGDQAWAAMVNVQGGVPTAADLILVQAGSSLLALQVASPVGLPPKSQVTAMATTAVAKLAP